MPDDGSAARPRPPIGTARGEDEDADRFVFGADPVRDRWWGRPLAETRAWAEFGRLLADPVLYGAGGVPRGDGRPVVLVPGFLAGDQTLSVIGAWLRRLGYRPRICGFITNTDCSDRALDRVERRVHALSRSHGRRVALIGHSRGGHFARAVAARRPDLVSHAISMGADLQGMFGASTPTLYAVSLAREAVHALGRARKPECLTGHCGCAFSHDYARPFPFENVRLTSIYSKGDGVVHWQCQVVPHAECVEVTGSHVGLVFNRKVYRDTTMPALDARRSTLDARCSGLTARTRGCRVHLDQLADRERRAAMAKSKREKELARKLRAGGLRKRPAKLIAGASDGRRKPTKKVQRVVDDLGKVLSDHKDRVKGGSAKRKAAAKKAAKTRKQNAARRSKAAKKGARTRAKSRT